MDSGSTFTSGKITKEMSIFKQIQHFAGVGAHHHNGIAEHNIQTVMSMACASAGPKLPTAPYLVQFSQRLMCSLVQR
jgi:hypothetical protein